MSRFGWQTAYFQAVLETKEGPFRQYISEAENAIRDRFELVSMVEPDERQALTEALENLAILKVEQRDS